MKVLMMASSPRIGLTCHLARLSINLKKAGHNVIVLSGPKEQVSGLSDSLIEAKIKHFKSDNVDKTSIQDIYRSKNDINKIISSNEIDVIHAQGAIDALEAYLAVHSLRSLKRPAIATSVNFVPINCSSLSPRWATMTCVLNKCSDVNLPVSNYTRNQLISNGVFPEKTITIHNAIDLDLFDEVSKEYTPIFDIENTDKPIIASVARLIRLKGQNYFLMAASELLKYYSAKFLIVGSGPQRKDLEELACFLRIDEHVRFTGYIQWPDIYFFLSNVPDICVSPSFSENFPYYILECMAARKPVVATNVGGVSESVVDRVTGYLVPPKEPHLLSNAIIELLEEPDKAARMGLEARRIVERHFSMPTLTKKLSVIYRRIAE